MNWPTLSRNTDLTVTFSRNTGLTGRPKLEIQDELADLVEGLVAGALDAEVDHRVGKGPTHVELQGQVVNPLKYKKGFLSGSGFCTIMDPEKVPIFLIKNIMLYYLKPLSLMSLLSKYVICILNNKFIIL